MTTNSLALDVAQRFVAALNDCDEAAVRAVYAPDATIWHNFDGKYQTVDENVRMLHWLHRTLADVDYDIVRREATSDGFFQQHVLRGKLSSGEPFAMHACVICRVDADGRITTLEEYLDLNQAAPLSA